MHGQGMMYMKPIWFLFSELWQTIPTLATLCVAIVGRESLRMLKLMGWSDRQPRYLTPLPASLFFHCLIYFMRDILWDMRALVRLTALLYLCSWFPLFSHVTFRFLIFLSYTPLPVATSPGGSQKGCLVPLRSTGYMVCTARPGDRFCLLRPLLLHAASTLFVTIASIVFLLNTQTQKWARGVVWCQGRYL